MRLFSRQVYKAISQLHVIFQFRGLWLWLFIIWSLLKVFLAIPSALFWGIFGLFLGLLLTKAWDSNPLFIRSYGDSIYMINNPICAPACLKTHILEDNILISVFGSSRDKAMVVYPLFIRCLKFSYGSPLKLGIDGAQIINQKDNKTLYLKLSDSNLLYAFPDEETYTRFRLWADGKGYQIHEHDQISERDIQRYLLGPVITSAISWSDQDILQRTSNWHDKSVIEKYFKKYVKKA